MSHVFISHATADDAFVDSLRTALADQGIQAWVDSHRLRGGMLLAPEVSEAVETAEHFLAVLSPAAVNSTWVRKEVNHALEVSRARKDGYKVIPLLLTGVTPAALGLWFDEEPVAIVLDHRGLSWTMTPLLVALGKELPRTAESTDSVMQTKPVNDLVLTLRDPTVVEENGERTIKAVATVTFEPFNDSTRRIESKRFEFTAPLDPVASDELRWYLEEYFRWPVGVFADRAKHIESLLPEWGMKLYESALGVASASPPLNAWHHETAEVERRFSIEVDSEPPEGALDGEHTNAARAASTILSLPWELIHDTRGFLFHGRNGVRVRRRLPNRIQHQVRSSSPPIRILLLSPRPESKLSDFIDHRVCAKPLVNALASLGDLVRLDFLTPPNLPMLQKKLLEAARRGEEYDVVHFDGHGAYNFGKQSGVLCFEDPSDSSKLESRAVELVDANTIGAILRDHRVPLVFLEACQSARSELNPTSSLAANLLAEGVASVVAMSHNVLVETSRRFVEAFYEKLATGGRIGEAMLAGQRALETDAYRGKMIGAGNLYLQDWFVPVLYQDRQDTQLISLVPTRDIVRYKENARKLSLGSLPDSPEHNFVGRSRELLKLERLLHTDPYAVLVGRGGSGKTTLAAELARWFVQTQRFDRTAFVALDSVFDARSVLDSIGQQLIPDYTVAEYPDLDHARQPIEKALREYRSILIIDNVESLMPSSKEDHERKLTPLMEILALCKQLQDADSTSRTIFTSRESLPQPYSHPRRQITLGPLTRDDAVELVSQVMKLYGLEPLASDPGGTPEEITELVEAAGFHARALVLLTREVSRCGVRGTTTNLRKIMSELEQRNPGDRENSLYASVELSLRRLPVPIRDQVDVLAVFHGGASISVVGWLLDLPAEEVTPLKHIWNSLISVGLANPTPFGFLILDSALSSHLLETMGTGKVEDLREKWAEGMLGIVHLLNEKIHNDVYWATQLVLLESSNLLELLAWMTAKKSPEEVVNVSIVLESILMRLGNRRVLNAVIQYRELSTNKMEMSGVAGFQSQLIRIQHMIDEGDVKEASTSAHSLLKHALGVGDTSDPNSKYHVGVAHLTLGHALHRGGEAEQAFPFLVEARRRFTVLANEGNTLAKRMLSVSATHIGDCLQSLGRLEEALTTYQSAVAEASASGDSRQYAVVMANLGMLKKKLWKIDEALQAFEEAQSVFARLNEPASRANILFHIGVIHRTIRNFDVAERILRDALALSVRGQDRVCEANSLLELSSLSMDCDRADESIQLATQSASIFSELGDLLNEGKSRSNLAYSMVLHGQYENARRQLCRALECKAQFGYIAEPWTTWDILSLLEKTTGNLDASLVARSHALQGYIDYRRSGGKNENSGEILFSRATEALASGKIAEFQDYLDQVLSAPDTHPQYLPLIPKLKAILAGERNIALAEDSNLHYTDEAELKLLLNTL